MSVRHLKHWGWGYEDQQQSVDQLEAVATGARQMLGFGSEATLPVALEDVEIRSPRLKTPSALPGMFSDGHRDRVSHTLGCAYRDLVRGFRGEFENPPDLVAFPRDGNEVEDVLAWAEDQNAAVIPYGGGTSVCGGVEARLPDLDRPVVSLDLGSLDRLVEVDPVSLAARIGAGIKGPALESALAEHGLTLRHFPQSFEYSTLGGWIATRAGGHFATGETHIDDLVESIRAVTPRGDWISRRLPGSGAGPSPDRMLIGSEGTLGVITEAWMRVRERPGFRASRTVEFDSFTEGAEAARAIAQARINPSNCRVIDATEAQLMGAGDGGSALLLLGFESAHLPVDGQLETAVGIAREHGGQPQDPKPEGGRSETADSWRSAFLQVPYLRDSLIACGILTETFETAITWDRFEDFHAEVIDATRRSVARVTGAPVDGEGAPRVSCRLTHVYPDGCAPYFTVVAPARRGSELEQWDEIKAAASEALIGGGGTITHHHAVGRDHRPWYDRQRPAPFAAALRAAKAELDPAAVLNPGVLIDP